jgi:hypothetical protein
MMTYNWCHNPDCHTYHTQDRIRGVKGSKVLRTRKIKVHEPLPQYYQGWENHFCRVACFFNYVKKHINNIVAISPVNEPSEKPIDVQVVKHPEETTSYGWVRKAWTEKKIVEKNNQQ